MTKPALSYYGGKQRIASAIVEQINKIPHTVYVEAFAGGAAVLYAKGRRHVSNKDDYREVLNDTNNLLVTFYRMAREQPEELDRLIQFTPHSQLDHKKAIEICKNSDRFSDLDVAWAVFVNLNQSFANEMGCGWRAGTIGRNDAATWRSKQMRLLLALDRIRDVHISCEDALVCINRWDSGQTLIYADPPYPGANQGHYSGYTIDDWQALCDRLDECNSSYILSNYPQTIAPKSAQQVIEISATMSAAKDKNADKERTEVLWICDRSHGARSDLQKLLSGNQLTLLAW